MNHTPTATNRNHNDGKTSSLFVAHTPTKPDIQLHGASRFQITREISKTLQGRVVMATDISTYQRVVIKEAWKALVDAGLDRSGLHIAEDFLYERDLMVDLAKKKHDGIIKLIDHWETDKCYCYAMECCQLDLFDYISKHFGLSDPYRPKQPKWRQKPMRIANEWVRNMSHVMYQLCTTIQWLHRKRYCHLDISLENVMFYDVKKLKIKLIDFGLTQAFNKEGNAQFVGRNGKTQYMAPEIWNNERYDGTKADVWSLGIVLYAVLVGALPYNEPDIRKDRGFYGVIRGDIQGVLRDQQRLCLMTEPALDLLHSMLQYEDKRIALDDVIKHSFFNTVKGEHRSRGRQRWRVETVDPRRVSRSRTR